MTSSKQAKSSQSNCSEIEVIIESDGDLKFIYTDDVFALLRPVFENLETSRASAVEPDKDGNWTIDVSPLLGGQPRIIATALRRDEAIAAEIGWLRKYLEGSL